MRDINMDGLDLSSRLAMLHMESRQTKLKLFFLIIVVMFGLMTWLVWLPQYRDAQRLDAAVDQKLKALTKQAEVINQRVEIERDLQVLRLQIPTLIAGFPDRNQLPDLLERIYGELQVQGMQLVKFKPKSEKPGEVLSRVPVEMIVQGRSDGITSIPNILAGLSRKVNLSDFSIKPANEPGFWIFDGQVDAYIQIGTSADLLGKAADETTRPSKGGAR